MKKNKILSLLLIISYLFSACSNLEHAEEKRCLVKRDAEPMNVGQEDTKIPFESEEYVCLEQLYTARYLHTLTSKILRFDNLIFVDNDCYEYKDGHYHYLQGKGIMDSVPMEANGLLYVTQTNNFLIYQWYEQISSEKWGRVVLVDPYTREQVKCFDIQGSFAATYEDEIYYKVISNDGSSTLERINCIDMNKETVFSSDSFIRNIITGSDKTLMVFVKDDGWWKIDPSGETTFLLEEFDGVRDEYLQWYDEYGYYSMIEYKFVCELLHIKDDGTYERLYNMLNFERLVFLEKYFVEIDDKGTIYLYNYVYMPLEEELTQDTIMVEHHPFTTIRVVEDEILDAGYSLDAYHICDDKLWLFLKDDEKNLVVRSWEFETLEELESSMEVSE